MAPGRCASGDVPGQLAREWISGVHSSEGSSFAPPSFRVDSPYRASGFGRNHSYTDEHDAYTIWEGEGKDDRQGGADAAPAPDVVDFLGAPYD